MIFSWWGSLKTKIGLAQQVTMLVICKRLDWPDGDKTLCYVRYGEFHYIKASRAIESYIYLNIPELMIACNQWPLNIGSGHSRGYIGLIKGPTSRDGVMIGDADPDEGKISYQIVTDMLGKLATKEEA